MPNYAPRVSVCYADMSGVVQEWSKTCEKMVVYQHDPDQGCARTHIHALMINSKYTTAEALKRQFHSRVETDLTANELWAWSHKDYPNPDEGFIPYMTKGEHAPVFVKNFSPAELEAFRSQWVDLSTPKGKCLLDDAKDVKTKETKVKRKTRREICDIIDSKYDKLENKPVLLDKIADVITRFAVEVCNEEKMIYRKSRIQEYRDTVMGKYVPTEFTYFVNDDIYRYMKYNG